MAAHNPGTQAQKQQFQEVPAEAVKIKPEALTVALLNEINEHLLEILDELRADDDEGEYMFVQGTATTDLSLNITDLLAIMGHPVKQLLINNDDLKNNIEVGYNITPSSIDSNVQTAAARFFPIFPGEKFRAPYNRRDKGRGIRNVYLRTDTGTAAFRMWLLW